MLIDRTSIIAPSTALQFGDEKAEVIAALQTLALVTSVADFFMKQMLATALWEKKILQQKIPWKHEKLNHKSCFRKQLGTQGKLGTFIFSLPLRQKM